MENILLSGSSDGRVKAFDTTNFTLLQSIKADSKDVSCLSLDINEQYFAFADESNSVYIYSAKDFNRLKKVEMAAYGSVSAITFHKIETITFMFICIKEYGVFFMEETNFKKLTDDIEDIVELKPRRPYTAIEMYKEHHLLFAIDTDCTISVWDAKDFLPCKKRYLPIAKFDVSPAYNDFYLKYLNNLFIMLNRNGHCFFKCTDFRKLHMHKISEHKYRKINMTQRERSHTIGFNHLYTMIAVNIDRTNSNTNENCPFSCELMIYADSNPNEIILKKSISEKYMSLEFNINVFVISPNPKYDNIFITGDSDGKIVIWDLATLQVLSIFKEYCTHIGQPAISNPILELAYAKSGNEFFVSTFYGCISFYSALDSHDNIIIEPDEQFFSSDFTEDQIVEFCNVELQPHKVCTWTDERGIAAFNISRLKKISDKKSKIEVINNHNMIEFDEFFKEQKKDYYERHKLNESELNERLKAFRKPEVIEKAVESKIIKEESSEVSHKLLKEPRSKQFVSARLNKNISNIRPESDESEYSDSSEEIIKRNRNKKPKTRRLKHISETSSPSVTNQIHTNGHTRGNHNIERPTFDQFQQTFENYSRTQGDSRTNKKCSICNADNAKFSCNSCDLIFDFHCKNKFLVETSSYEINCYDCYFYKRTPLFKQNLAKQQLRPFLVECNRDNWNISTQYEIDQDINFMRYIPQLGDCFYFIPDAFIIFIKEYHMIVDAELYIGKVNNLIDLKKDFLVEVVNSWFTFPWVNYKYEYSKFISQEKNDLHVFLNLELKVVTEDAELPVNTIIKTSFTISNNIDSIFLIPEHVYELGKQLVKNIDLRALIEYKQKLFVIKAIKKVGPTFFGSIELSDLNCGIRARSHTRETDIEKVHPWVLALRSENYNTILNVQPNNDNSEYLELLTRKMRTLKHRYNLFIEDVDKNIYADYLAFVEVEMNITLIQKRLENQYYKSKDQLQKDIRQIEENAIKFNDPTSDVIKLANELVNMLIELISKTTIIPIQLDKHNFISENSDEEILMPRKRRKIF